MANEKAKVKEAGKRKSMKRRKKTEGKGGEKKGVKKEGLEMRTKKKKEGVGIGKEREGIVNEERKQLEEEVNGEKMRIKLRYRQRKGLGVGGELQEKRFGGWR